MANSALPSHVACPACQQVTPLPSQTALTAVVRCPHCRAQFALRDLLGDPEVVWQLVSDTEQELSDRTLAGTQTAPELNGDREDRDDRDAAARDAGTAVEDIEQATDAENYYAVASSETPPAVSPGAETVEMSGCEALAEGPTRQLEGPLVGEFPDEPEPEFEYPGESSWRSAAERSAVAQPQQAETTTLGELHEDSDSGFQSFLNGPAVRRSHPRRSPLWSMLQVGLGGLAAIPVSLLLMWHLLGTDVGGAAPWVAQYAPWIVPQKFHAYAPSSATVANSLPSGAMVNPSAAEPGLPPLDQAASADSPADGIPTVQPRSTSDVDLASDSLDAAANSLATGSPTSDSASTADTMVKLGRSDAAGHPSRNYAAEMPESSDTTHDIVDSYELDSESLAAMLDGLEPPDAELDSVRPLDDAAVDFLDDATPGGINLTDNSALDSPDELDSAALENCFTLIREATSMLEEWSLAVSVKQHDMALAQVTYGELASLALAIDELPSRELVQQAMRGQLRSVRKQVEQKLDVRNLIDQGARFWIRSQSQRATEAGQETTGASSARPMRPSGSGRYGLALTAVVDSVTPSGDDQWSTVTASATTQSGTVAILPLELRIPQDLINLLPEGELSVGQKLFLLGTVKLPTADGVDDSNAVSGEPPFEANYMAPL